MWMLTIGARIVYPAVMPGMQAEFEFGYTTVGLLVGAVWGSYAIMQYPGGFLADIRSDRVAVTIGMSVMMLGLVLILVGLSFELLVVATIVMGAGTGLIGPSRVIILVNEFPSARSTVVSISQAAGSLGNAIFPIIAGSIMTYAGWRVGLGFLLPLCLIVTVLLWLLVPTRAEQSNRDSIATTLASTARALNTNSAIVATSMMLGVMLVFQSLTGFLPTYFIDVSGFSTAQATRVFGLFFVTGLLMQLLAGLVGDRLDPGKTVGVFAGLAIPGVALLLISESFWVLVIGVILASALLGCFPPGLTYLAATFPPRVQGAGFGIVRSVYIGGGALGPVGVGVLADFYSLWIGLFSLGIVLCGIIVLAPFLPALSTTYAGKSIGLDD